MNGWVSIIPNYMYERWERLGYIKRGAWNFVDYKFKRTWRNILTSYTKRSMCRVKDENYKKMLQEVEKWYSEIFKYVTAWLTECGYIKLKKGSFSGGFCATPTEDDTTKGWGAPLAEDGNKVIQIKEKFGRIVVYTGDLTVKQQADLAIFEKHVSEKYDCEADFC
jgi:hypothetical protein